MPAIGKSQALAAKKMKTAKVPVPEWAPDDAENPDDYYVTVRELTGQERDDYESSQMVIDKKGRPQKNVENLRARLAVLVCVNEDGSQLFSKYDIPDLGRTSSKALDRIYEKASDLSGLDEESVEEDREVFGEGQNSASITG